MTTRFKRPIVYFWVNFSFILMSCSIIFTIVAIKEQEYLLLVLSPIIAGISIIIYFEILFGLVEIWVDQELQTMYFHFPFSFKKKKIIPLNDLMGYYLNIDRADEGNYRSIILVVNNEEFTLSDSYYSNFNVWQAYALKNHPMISHKTHRVYSPTRKEQELEWYFSSYRQTPKIRHQHYTGESYALLAGSVLGYVLIIYDYGFELNSFFVGYVIVALSLFAWLQHRGRVKKRTGDHSDRSGDDEESFKI
jgi:hypothetical protein